MIRINSNTGVSLWNQTTSLRFSEPFLLITQTAVSQSLPQAGRTIAVTITLTRDPSTTAPSYDVSISRTFAAELQLIAAPVSTFGTVTWSASQFRVSIPKYLSTDLTVTITLTLRIQNNVYPKQALSTNYLLVWQSSPDSSSSKNYSATSLSSVTNIASLATNATIVSTSWIQTNPLDGNIGLSVGEVGVIEIIVSLIQGVNPMTLVINVDGAIAANLGKFLKRKYNFSSHSKDFSIFSLFLLSLSLFLFISYYYHSHTRSESLLI